MKAMKAKTPTIPTPTAFRPAPAVTTDVDGPVLTAGTVPAPAAPELVGVTVARPDVAVFTADHVVPLR